MGLLKELESLTQSTGSLSYAKFLMSSSHPPRPTSAVSNSLSPERKQVPITELERPRPESDLSRYTLARTQEGLEYAQRRLNSTASRPPPNAEGLFKIYIIACRDHLAAIKEGLSDGAKQAHLGEIRKYEQDIYNRSWFAAQNGEAQQELQEWILKLRKIQISLRYGRYTVLVSENLALKDRVGAYWDGIPDKHLQSNVILNKNGTAKQRSSWQHQMCEKLHEEQREWTKSGSSHIDLVPASFKLYNAALNVGMTFETARDVLYKFCAADKPHGGGLSQSELLENLELAEAGIIKQCLFTDMAELLSVAGSSREDRQWKSALLVILTGLRDTWFDYTMKPNLPGSWSPKRAFWTAHKEILGEQRYPNRSMKKSQLEAMAEDAADQILANEREELAVLAKVEDSDNVRDICTPSNRQSIWDEVVKQQEGCHSDWRRVDYGTEALLQRQRQITLFSRVDEA